MSSVDGKQTVAKKEMKACEGEQTTLSIELTDATGNPAADVEVIFEIVEALDGPLSVFYCVGTDKKKFDCLCSPDKCLTQKVWHELQRSILKTLRGFTLADLVKDK